MMRIPSDYQVQVPAPRSGVLEALGLKTGQTVTGQVVGQTPDGAAQVKIGNQVISLALPIKPQLGLIVQFQVKSMGAKPELVLLANQPTTATTTALPDTAAVLVSVKAGTAPPAQTSAPPTGQQTQSNTAQTSAAPNTSTPAQAQPQIAAQTQVATQTPPSQSTPPTRTGQPAPANTPPPPSPPLPASVQTTLQLQPGQIIRAEVLAPLPNGQQQVLVNGQTVSVNLPGSPAPGTTVQLQAQILDGVVRLSLAPQSSGQPQSPSGAAPNTSASTAAPTSAKAPPTNLAQQILTQTQQTALAKQDSLGTLFTNLAGLKPSMGSLPADVAKAAERLLATQLNVSKGAPDAALLRDAIGRSGVFLEANLGQGQVPSSSQGDIKGLLLILKNAFGSWLGDGDAQLLPHQRPAPPIRGATPRSPMAERGNLPEGGPLRDSARHLMNQTDSALSRVRLFQMASLPDAAARAHATGAPMEWNMELPLLLGQEMAMAQFQISRDGNPDGGAGERGWQMAFSVNFSRTGEVGAKITLRGKRTGVMLWAESDETAETLEGMLPELVLSLGAQGLDPGLVIVRRGAPDEQDAGIPTPLDSLL